MNIGNKIKRLRIERGLTQQQLSGDKITRNMLSCIESGKALPSIDTLMFVADRLSVPASYLLSNDEDLFFYKKSTSISKIKEKYKSKKYQECMDIINQFEKTDDELSYILSICNFELGKLSVLSGNLITAKKHLQLSKKYATSTIYDTSLIELKLTLYSGLAENIQSPLLELELNRYNEIFDESTDIELLKYITQDHTYNFKNKLYAIHLNAKEMIKTHRYIEAVSELKKLEEYKTRENYNAYLVLSVYNDLEICYKNLSDFENAYRYCNKRLSLLEGFKS